MSIKLDNIIETLESVDREKEAYLNPETNEIFYSNIGDYVELSEDELDDLFEKSIMLPTQFDINEYGMMRDFIETIEDPKLYNQLQIAINGKGAFRRFKDTCINFEIENNWYKFRDEQYKKLAIEWCKNNHIDFE